MTITGEKFKKIRNKLGLSQEEMGKRLGGYTKTTILLWEKGKKKIPTRMHSVIEELDGKTLRPITRKQIADAAFALHEAAKEDGQELERPYNGAKAVLRLMGYDVDNPDGENIKIVNE